MRGMEFPKMWRVSMRFSVVFGFVLGAFIVLVWPMQSRMTTSMVTTSQGEQHNEGCDGGYMDDLVPLVRYSFTSDGHLRLEYIFVQKDEAAAILQAQGGCEPPPEELPRCQPLEQITDI